MPARLGTLMSDEACTVVPASLTLVRDLSRDCCIRPIRPLRAARMTRRVLVIGKDGRTDAIAEACSRSAGEPELYALAEMPIPGLLEKCRDVFIGSLADVG